MADETGSGDRRYSDDEVREIFGRAAEGDAAGGPVARTPPDGPGSGLTLSELQEIAEEVGLDRSRVAEAASALDRVGAGITPRRTLLGTTIGVGRVVELPRAPTDREWEILVSELRHTFDAKGRLESDGGLRSWMNGRLHADIEPTPSGYRLRLGTTKTNGMLLGSLGIVGLVTGLAWLLALLVTGAGLDGATVPLMYGLMGAGALIANAIRLPPWAREREQQMEYIAERATALLSVPADDAG